MGLIKFSYKHCSSFKPKVIVESSKKFGSQCIVVAIDAKKNGDIWEIFTHGGRNKTGINALEFAKEMEKKGQENCLLLQWIKMELSLVMILNL